MWHDYLRVWHAQWHFFARWWWAEALVLVAMYAVAAGAIWLIAKTQQHEARRFTRSQGVDDGDDGGYA